MKLAYALADNSNIPGTHFHGVWIWKLDILPKIINFLWLCMHKSVPVNNTLFSRGVIEENKCPLCKRMPETIGHLLRECVYVCDFWYKGKIPLMVVSSFQAINDTNDWLRVNCLSKAIHHFSVPWRYVFPFSIWELWKHRNKVAFENTPLNLNLQRPCISQVMEYFFCVGKINKQRTMAVIPVRWEKPHSNWFKLNINGASCGNPRRAGGGGVLQDNAGEWVKGFAKNIGSTTSIIDEFWALRDGLQMAILLDVQNLEVELDAKVVLDLICSKNSSNATYSSLLFDYRLLLDKIPHTTVKHVFREANKCADALARIVCNV